MAPHGMLLGIHCYFFNLSVAAFCLFVVVRNLLRFSVRLLYYRSKAVIFTSRNSVCNAIITFLSQSLICVCFFLFRCLYTHAYLYSSIGRGKGNTEILAIDPRQSFHTVFCSRATLFAVRKYLLCNQPLLKRRK